MNEWKQGVPTVPGNYWVYQNDDGPPVIFEVDDEGDILQMGYYGDVCINYSVEADEVAKYYWLPIEMPTVPEEIKRKVR